MPSLVWTTEESVDLRYAATFKGFSQLASLTGWSASRRQQSAYAYVEYSDEIYQTFVAYVLAESLRLEPIGSILGLAQPAFVSSEWEMFCNTIPPKHVMRSWRSYTDSPDRFRPDIVLHNKNNGEVAVCDTKYRNNGTQASETSRKDVMAYMAAFDISKAIIFYPPSPIDQLGIHSIKAQDRELLEVTVSPTGALKAFLADEFPEALIRACVNPTWRN
jgi:hypothetical protein